MGIIEGAISRGQAIRSRGLDLYVDTAEGSDSNDGQSWEQARKTIASVLTLATDFSQVNVVGDLREQIVAPLGIQGVKIVGAAYGNTRHDDGVRWREPASPVAGKALLEIREQGWEFDNILFVANATGAAIKAHRNEDASFPDSSHFIARRCKFAGGQTGIEDVGGNHHYRVEECEFTDLTTAILCSSTSIAVPLRNLIQDCLFIGNTNDIKSSFSHSVIRRNQFLTAGAGATNKVIDTVANSGQGGNNQVVLNVFANAEAEIAPGSGYSGAATDLWLNYVNDQAALAVGQPA